MSSPFTDIDTQNRILGTLSHDGAAVIEPLLEKIDLRRGDDLYQIDDKIDRVFFPDTAMVSVVTTTYSGQMAESGVIGFDGIVGVEALMGERVASNRYLVQLPGSAYRADVRAIMNEFEKAGEFQRHVLKFVRDLMVQMSQTALCNRLHVAEQRFAKWLLMCDDRSFATEMPITQEFAALMLGSNRVSVVQASKALEERGLIQSRRAAIRIADRKGLEEFACECYERIRREWNRPER